MMTSLMAWNLIHTHETSHWVRYHGTTVGVFLTLLRATRDSLADHVLRILDNKEIAFFQEERAKNRRLFASHPTTVADELGDEVTEYSKIWLSLYYTYSVILGMEPLAWPRGDALNKQRKISLALDTTWRQWQGRAMLPRAGADLAEVHDFAPLLGGEEPVTTRLLFECAGLLDEGYHFRGPYPQLVHRSLSRIWEHSLKGEYGEPYRVAERLANRKLSHSEVLALIDFALNPPLPGFHRGVTSIDWRELYPPYRFMFAAVTLRKSGAYAHSEADTARPLPEHVDDFFREVTTETDVRVGSIDSILTRDAALRDTSDPTQGFAERIPRMILLFASLLNQERTQDVAAISHFGSYMIDPAGIRLLDPDASDYPWWFFAPFRVINNGVFGWPDKRLDIDASTDLFIGSAISSAYDDIVHSVGPLDVGHLPADCFRDPDEVNALNDILRSNLRINIRWAA